MSEHCPYKGLVPYGEEDARYFFGCDRERRLISAALRASRLTVLYGESGAGKSSVLAAGVAHDLRDDPDYALVLFRNWRDEPMAGLLTAVRQELSKLPGFTPHGNDRKPRDLLQHWSEATKRALLIVLDQFEEYFEYHRGESGSGTLAEELPRLLSQAELAVNFLLAVREDALGTLDRFKGAIPNLFDNLLRVEHLTRKAAQEAIVEPLKRFNEDLRAGGFSASEDHLHPIEIEEQVAAQVVSEILRAQGEEQERVQAPYLQLVMTRWWEREMESESPAMRLDVLYDLGGVKTIVERYLEDTLASLSPQDKEIVAEVFRYMVTPTGRKIAQTTTDLTNNLLSFLAAAGSSTEGPPVSSLVPDLLSRLQAARLLRKVPPPRGSPPDEPFYEFAHDVVAKAAFEWRRQFRRTQQLAEAERKEKEANQRAEEQARLAEVERQLSLKANLLAEESARRAEAERQRAEEQRQRAESEQLLARKAELLAAQERRRAEEQARLADAQGQLAAKAKQVAEETERRAETERQRADEQAAAARRLRRIMLVSAVIALFASVASGVAFYERHRAQINEERAQMNERRAQEGERKIRDFLNILKTVQAKVLVDKLATETPRKGNAKPTGRSRNEAAKKLQYSKSTKAAAQQGSSAGSDPIVQSRIKNAWAALSPDERNRIAQPIVAAHQQAVVFSQNRTAPVSAVPPSLLLLQAVLTDDPEGVVRSLRPGVVFDVGPDGKMWSTRKYGQLDLGWAEAAAVWLEHLIISKHPFADTAPSTIPIPNQALIALAGDWGTGDWRTAANPAPSTNVRQHIAFLQPHLTIHLGGVYYAGTSDQEQHLLVNLWPKGSLGSLALNSDYEMYSGARPYFGQALASSLFALQQQRSFFALENDHWVIVGLDSAYYAVAEGLYMDGSLYRDAAPKLQLDFLKEQVAKGKKTIVLTHHNGLTEDGSTTTNLWSQVMSAFPEGNAPAYWYWGHVQAGVVYQPRPHGAANVLCRAIGHGGLPWGRASELANNPNVVWYEQRFAKDPDIPQRVLNGFAVLHLDGPNINEVFYDENGGVAWP